MNQHIERLLEKQADLKAREEEYRTLLDNTSIKDLVTLIPEATRPEIIDVPLKTTQLVLVRYPTFLPTMALLVRAVGRGCCSNIMFKLPDGLPNRKYSVICSTDYLWHFENSPEELKAIGREFFMNFRRVCKDNGIAIVAVSGQGSIEAAEGHTGQITFIHCSSRGLDDGISRLFGGDKTYWYDLFDVSD